MHLAGGPSAALHGPPVGSCTPHLHRAPLSSRNARRSSRHAARSSAATPGGNDNNSNREDQSPQQAAAEDKGSSRKWEELYPPKMVRACTRKCASDEVHSPCHLYMAVGS